VKSVSEKRDEGPFDPTYTRFDAIQGNWLQDHEKSSNQPTNVPMDTPAILRHELSWLPPRCGICPSIGRSPIMPRPIESAELSVVADEACRRNLRSVHGIKETGRLRQ
jgi:hypothetical protein